MRVSFFKILTGIVALNLLLFIFSHILPFQPVRILLGIPFLLFFPGFVTLMAIAPRRNDLGNTERITLSFVLSVVVVSFIGFILNYTVFGVNLESITTAVAFFLVAASIPALRALAGPEPPPISTTMLQMGSVIGNPAPMAAAMGSSIK